MQRFMIDHQSHWIFILTSRTNLGNSSLWKRDVESIQPKCIIHSCTCVGTADHDLNTACGGGKSSFLTFLFVTTCHKSYASCCYICCCTTTLSLNSSSPFFNVCVNLFSLPRSQNLHSQQTEWRNTQYSVQCSTLYTGNRRNYLRTFIGCR